MKCGGDLVVPRECLGKFVAHIGACIIACMDDFFELLEWLGKHGYDVKSVSIIYALREGEVLMPPFILVKEDERRVKWHEEGGGVHKGVEGGREP